MLLSPQPRIVGTPPNWRLAELDGLRCFLSWWVVFSHILESSGFRYEELPPLLRVAVRGGYAVDVFIILSGFVITKLLAEKNEPYRVFILRRFLRLFPVFAVTMLIAILLRPLIWSSLAAGWPADPLFLQNNLANWESEEAYFWIHLLGHLPMLHGLAPETFLPFSAVAILPPAWSISLEWQYYLVASIGRRLGPLGWFGLVSGAVLVPLRFRLGLDALFPMQSTLPQKLLLFLLGAICYWIFAEVAGKHRDLPWRFFFFVAPAVLWFTLSIPLAIWTAGFALTLGDSETPGVSKVKAWLDPPWIQRLGKISYSTYLVHMPCVWLAQAWLARSIPAIDRVGMLIGLLAIVVPTTVVASEILFRLVEQPGMRLGRRLTRRATCGSDHGSSFGQ
jgi:peptidoglycan/LPS O-acetylase OafA/YrhL